MVQVLQYLLLLFIVLNNKEIYCEENGYSEAIDGSRIIGGHSVTIKDFPYQVYLVMKAKGKDKYSACGGSIINPKTVLTAAHCIDKKEWALVRFGSSDSASGGHTSRSKNLVTHPQWNPKTFDWDVGIIQLDQAMHLDGSSARAVKLAESGDKLQAGTKLLTSGWGLTTNNGSTSRYLLAVEVPVVSYQDCRKSYGYITPRMLCAGQSGRNFCNGDSGGPAVVKSTGVQVGIVSYYAVSCSDPRFPGVYANVAETSIRNFIRQHTKV